MLEKVDLIERVEGHVGINLEIKSKGRLKLKFGIKEGPRLFEKFLEGRNVHEIPFFVERICGFCPIVHNLSAIKALENTLDVTPSQETIAFRRALNAMEMIQSHSAHLYMLTLPDYIGDSEDIFEVGAEKPELVQQAVQFRNNINAMIETLGGRTVHPTATRIGGFSRFPSNKELQKDLTKLTKMKPIAEKTIELITDLEYPILDFETHYLSLGREDTRYPLYDGKIITSHGKTFEPTDYGTIITEKTVPYSSAKFSYIEGKPYLVGALARMNLNKNHLNSQAKQKVKDIPISFPSDNPFHNNVAQAIEMLHCIEEIETIYKTLLEKDYESDALLEKELQNPSSNQDTAGTGVDAVEAPRGTLFHKYTVNEEGLIDDADILTPTAQSAAKIEQHLNGLVTELEEVSYEEMLEEIKKLVRAYDPCISCSVH